MGFGDRTKPLHFDDHFKANMRIAYSPNGNRMASCSYDFTSRLWDVESGTCLHVLARRKLVTSIVYPPRGDVFAFNGSESVRLWDAETGHCRQILIGYQLC